MTVQIMVTTKTSTIVAIQVRTVRTLLRRRFLKISRRNFIVAFVVPGFSISSCRPCSPSLGPGVPHFAPGATILIPSDRRADRVVGGDNRCTRRGQQR